MAFMYMDDEFRKQFGTDLHERIFFVMYGDIVDESISIDDIHKHDSINRTFSGSFEKDDETWYFLAEDGNNNGSVITDYGLEEKQIERVYTRRIYTPNYRLAHSEADREKMRKIYDYKRAAGEYEEMERSMNYDLFFEPTNKIYEHYKDWGLQRGLIIEMIEINPED